MTTRTNEVMALKIFAYLIANEVKGELRPSKMQNELELNRNSIRAYFDLMVEAGLMKRRKEGLTNLYTLTFKTPKSEQKARKTKTQLKIEKRKRMEALHSILTWDPSSREKRLPFEYITPNVEVLEFHPNDAVRTSLRTLDLDHFLEQGIEALTTEQIWEVILERKHWEGGKHKILGKMLAQCCIFKCPDCGEAFDYDNMNFMFARCFACTKAFRDNHVFR